MLDLTDLGFELLGIDHDVLAYRQVPVHQGTGNDGAEALDGEDTVHGEAEGLVGGMLLEAFDHLQDLVLQLRNPLPGIG